MTLSTRNGVLHVAVGLLAVLTLGYGTLAWWLVVREGWTATVGQGSLWLLLVQTAYLPVLGLAGFFLLRSAYRKSAAPEAFFFALFLTTLGTEALLLLQVWLSIEGLPAFYTAVLTRILWAFRFAGLGFLFCGSLFAFGFSYRKFGNLVLWCLLVGGSLAVLLPLHSTTARNHLLFAVGDAPGMVLAASLVAAVVSVNYLVGSRRPGSPDRARGRAWAAVCFLASWACAIGFGPWGGLLAVPATVLAVWKVEENPSAG